MKDNGNTKTYLISHPWTVSINENGEFILWFIDVEIPREHIFQYLEEKNPGLNEDYIVSIRPSSKDMPIDEKLLALPKFINEPFNKNES